MMPGLRPQSLTFKVTFLTVLVSILLWGGVDFLLDRWLTSLFQEQLNRQLDRQSRLSRLIFDNMVRSHSHLAKMIIHGERSVVLTDQASTHGSVRPRLWTRATPPPWLPKPSVLRTLPPLRFIVIYDRHGRAQEIYQGSAQPLPKGLSNPSPLLLTLSHQQHFLTMVDSRPFLLSAEELRDENGQLRSTLLVATPVDSELFYHVFHTLTPEARVGLLDTDHDLLMASSWPDELREGTPVAELEQLYLIGGKNFFDYGSSDLQLQFVNLLPRTEYQKLNSSILAQARINRALQGGVVILAFCLIMILLTRKIRQFSREMVEFSSSALGGTAQNQPKGDEFSMLRGSFEGLKQAINAAQRKIEAEGAEKLALLERHNAVLRKQRTLTLLETVTEAVGIGVMIRSDGQWRAANDCMRHYAEIHGGLSRFVDAERGEITIGEEQSARTFLVLRPALESDEECLLVQEITDRKRIEEERLKAQKLESVGVLAGGIAHDFNNLLTAVVGNIDIAKIYLDPASKSYSILDEAVSASYRARDLTKQLLTFSKGGAPVKKTVIISGMVREAVDFALRGTKMRCIFDIAEDIWPTDVDEAQLRQVLHNFVINASQAMAVMPGGGRIWVSCSNVTIGRGVSSQLRPGRYVKISVRDEGHGIPQGIMEKIFDPYFTTKTSGSGLGLATSYSIIKNHEGFIAVESEEGKGATFIVYLPASERGPEIQVVRELPEAQRGRRVLIMDDEEMVRELGFSMLEVLGYETESARDGAEALDLYQRAKADGKPFDVVIMDLIIPGGMGGREAAEKLLAIDPAARLIVSSGYTNDPVLADYRAFGFQGVLAKPYRLQELKEILLQVFGGDDQAAP